MSLDQGRSLILRGVASPRWADAAAQIERSRDRETKNAWSTPRLVGKRADHHEHARDFRVLGDR